jgi:hypothetical protein
MPRQRGEPLRNGEASRLSCTFRPNGLNSVEDSTHRWMKDGGHVTDYPSLARITVPVSLKDILGAFEFVSAGGGGEHEAFLCKQSGKLYCHSGLCDDLDILPDDIGDSEKFLQIPDKRELDLGKPLALDFARQFLPGDFDDVLQFFSRRGAYAKFKDLLGRRGVLDQWYDFEAKAEERALRMWCDLNSIEVSD